jgi:demethylmenaquinone methyltransferase/2-methoxy-6-polyprenyl-1,4-benzoquinol methylase
MAFGIRNVEKADVALREIWRVLRPGGRALILEFSVPSSRLVRGIYLFYFRHVLPRIGAAVAGDGEAYRYLNRTAETFAHGEAFCELLRQAGFVAVTALPLTLGIASIYKGDKPGGG